MTSEGSKSDSKFACNNCANAQQQVPDKGEGMSSAKKRKEKKRQSTGLRRLPYQQ